MTTRFHQRLIVAVLTLFVGMGTVVSAVQANDMAIKMAAMADSGSSGTNACTACGGDDGNAERAYCLPTIVCAPAVLSAPAAVAYDLAESPSMRSDMPPRGFTGVPDPSPPRLSVLG